MIKSNLLFQQQAQGMEENLSNLTSASGEASSCSGSLSDQIPANYSGSQYFSPPPPPPPKKKRNLPGNPDPDAEVIALSPKTLITTNRFICEICKKGFKRDQNLQLHRRGHNLPWKLKQRGGNKEGIIIRKKVYVCPETSCVHHDPSRALGDLTGIKKHFFRKHGDKKWKCDKCSKKYAVQSDWKAHSKTCGTREYRCDCGTLFSRRDSFITHRAFCDALAEESARAITTSNPILMANNNNNYNQIPPLIPTPISHLNFQTQITHFNPVDINSIFSLKKEQHQLINYSSSSSSNFINPPWTLPSCPPIDPNHNQDQLNPDPNQINQIIINNPNHLSSQLLANSPHMSATALLQKAAQMGATMSSSSTMQQHSRDHHVTDSSSSANTNNTNCNFGLNLCSSRVDSQIFQSGAFEAGGCFELDAFGGVLKKNNINHQIFNENNPMVNMSSEDHHQGRLSTRDFLGLTPISHSQFLSNIAAAAAAGYGSSNCINNNNNNNDNGAAQSPQTQIQNQPTWQG